MKLQLTLVAILISFFSIAQKGESDEYKKMKQELDQRVFETKEAIFSNNKLPDEFKNESAVVLAQKKILETNSKRKGNPFLVKGAKTDFKFTDIFHQKIFINDKSSLDEFSDLTFSKLDRKTKTFTGKYKSFSFVGIHIIKPTGTIKNIDVDESAVTVKENADSKKNKIAIPGLEIGDVIDYYIAKYFEINPYYDQMPSKDLLFVLADDYPIINYSISLDFDKRFAVQYQCINNAPQFKISADSSGEGTLMQLVASNLPKLKNTLWFSLPRQIPIIRINYNNDIIERKDMMPVQLGRVEKAVNYSDNIESKLGDLVAQIQESQTNPRYADYSKGFAAQRNAVKDAFKAIKKKNPQINQPDSIVDYVYRYYYWLDFFGGFNLSTDYENVYITRNLYRQILAALKFAYTLDEEFDIHSDIIFTGGRESVKREDLFDEATDLNVLVRTHGTQVSYFYFGDNLYHANEILASVENEKAKTVAFEFKRRSINFKDGIVITLPGTTYKDNAESEKLVVEVDKANMQLLNVYRKQNSKGFARRSNQSALLNFEDLALASGAAIEITDDLITQNDNRGKKNRKDDDEFKSLITKARDSKKEKFENEIKSSFDLKPKELKNYKVLKMGINNQQPDFEFEENFVWDGLVKKAGNNYIIEAGKLFGSQLEIKENQRNRKLDIYMPYPRSYQYHIDLIVPEGYTAEGLDNFNKKIENECGGFISSAKLNGNKVEFDILKYYINSFEPVKNWEKLTAFVDAAFALGKEKILLKKK
jgi:hypothetical protein